MMRRIGIVCLALTLSACVSLQPSAMTAQNYQAWPERYDALLALQSWQLTGAFSVVAPGQKPIIARYTWAQQSDNYLIQISSSLDLANATIQGNAEQVSLQASNLNAPMTARTPELLMQRALGWHVPVSDLRYWLLGMPAPISNTQGTWDAYGHVSELKQGGFTVQFSNYQHANNIDYPGIIQISGHDLQVKIVSRNLQTN